MKLKQIAFVFAMLVGVFTAAAQPRIAVLDFNAGVNVNQSDVNGLSAIFNTYFEPTGYAVVERTRVSRILEEHRMQEGKITEKELFKLGEILNVSVIVIGDVNRAMGQYNIDIRAVNVNTGEIVAKDGAEWAVGTSYRETMRAIAERISRKIPLVDLTRAPEPVAERTSKPIEVTPLYRKTGSYLRLNAGVVDLLLSPAYNYQITPSFMVGVGVGIGANPIIWQTTVPVYIEMELRTPRTKWSLFLNIKAGAGLSGAPLLDDFENWAMLNAAVGVGYKQFSFAFGLSYPSNTCLTVSYSIPLHSLFASSLF